LETQPDLREAKGLGDTGSIFVKGQCGYADTPVGVERFEWLWTELSREKDRVACPFL